MNWNLQPEIPYTNTGVAYSSSGVVMDFFEGLTYEHVNFIFSDPSYGQDCIHPVINTSAYKFGFSEPASFSYYDYCHPYEIGDHTFVNNEYSRHFEDPSTVADERSTAVNRQHDGHSSSQSHANSAECLQSYHSPHDYQVIWQDNVDPDNMTYEELLELGEVVGTQSRGLPQELISLLPISKFKCGFFSRKKKDERCVICQMEYKRGDRRITLPCNHIYHAGCGSRWLSINKACPICYKDVHVQAPKH